MKVVNLKKESKNESFEESVADVLGTKNEGLERFDVVDSPFTVVGNDDGWIGTMGKYRITENCKTKEECIEEVSEITWNRIVQVLILITQIKEEDNG